MDLYRLKEEYEQLCEQLRTVIAKVEKLLKEADIPNQPQPLELEEQKDTREKLIIQMENVKREMETEQEQKKEEDEKEIEEAKKIISQIQGEAANVLEKANKVENNLKILLDQMDHTKFDAELNQLKKELDKKETLELIIKQIIQKEMRKQTLQQVGKKFEETEIKQEVIQQITDNEKLKELLKQVLDDQIHQIKQLSTEELKESKYEETHEQKLIVTKLIQELITKIEPEICVHVQQAWQKHKDEKWIQDKVEEEIKKPIILAKQPLKTIHDIGQTRELVKKFVAGFLEFIHETQNKDMVEETTRIISTNEVKPFADQVKHQKFRLQQIQEQIQRIKEFKKEAEKIQLKALKCNQEELVTLQQQATKVTQQKEWDEYYMKIACLAALRSKDPKTPVSLVQHIGIIYMYCTL